jgi:CBS domain-containing protein
MSSTVRDVMSTHVIAARRSAPYKELAAMLRNQRVSAFPVVDDDNQVIGIVSESDLLIKEALEGTVPSELQGPAHQRLRSKVTALIAADLMTSPAVTIGPDEPVARAARLMYDRQVKRLPVTGEDGTLIGIVTRSDVLSVYSRPDAEIEHEITRNVVPGAAPGDPARFTVTVKGGIVTVEGAPESAQAGHAVIDAVRRAEGVVSVRDRLSYPAAAAEETG